MRLALENWPGGTGPRGCVGVETRGRGVSAFKVSGELLPVGRRQQAGRRRGSALAALQKTPHPRQGLPPPMAMVQRSRVQFP